MTRNTLEQQSVGHKARRVIYHGFTDQREITVDHLHKKHGWRPVAFLGRNIDKEWRAENYPSSLFIDAMEIRQARFDFTPFEKPAPIEPYIIEDLAKYELNFLGIIEDATEYNYSFLERKRYYFDILQYWNTVIHYLRPDLFVSFTCPHKTSCFSLYLLCKYKYSIDVLFFDPVPFFDQNYFVVGRSLEKFHEPFEKVYKSNEVLTPGPVVLRYLEDLRRREGLVPKHITNAYRLAKKKRELKRRVLDLLRIFGAALKRGGRLRKAEVAWKKNRKPYTSKDSLMNDLEYFFFVEKLRRANKVLIRDYKSFCVRPKLERKFVYFAAPYQPEAVTSVYAGVFEDVVLVLDMLTEAMPADWVLLFKEHPYTFADPLGKGNLRRSKDFYQKLASRNNIELVPSETNTYELIDRASCVATVGGTVGWEAIVRGVPALVFGGAWYVGCRSIFKIETLEDLRQAFRQIANGYSPDPLDVTRYAAAIEAVAFRDLLLPFDLAGTLSEKLELREDSRLEMTRLGDALAIASDKFEEIDRELKQAGVVGSGFEA